ncbi:MAG: MATE family efflux transporter [Succinivibrionaceae bacterium]|nr:MATE family efflux transporter [Succinivibrionaceae bacterium]
MQLKFNAAEAFRLLKLASPILLGSLATTGMAFTDTVMAGKVSSADLAGLSLATSIYILVVIPLSALMMAVTPVIAADHGACEPKKISFHFYQLLYSAAIATTIACLLNFGSTALFSLLDLEPRVQEIAERYLAIITAGIPFMFAFNSVRALTDGLSNTVITMFCCMTGLLFNVGLNYVFIYGRLGMPAMGGAGCAAATVIVQFLMLVFQLLMVNRLRYIRSCRIFSSPPKPDWKTIGNYFRLSYPLGLAMLFEIGIFSFFAFVVTVMGTKAIAANQIFFNYMTVLYMLPMSLSHAAAIRVGYTTGARDPATTRLTVSTSLLAGLAMALVIGILSFVFRRNIAQIYTDDPQVLELLADAFICVSVYQLSDYCQTIGIGVLRGLLDTKIITVMAVITYWFFAAPVALMLCFTGFMWGPHGFTGLCIALSVSLYILAVAYLLRINRHFSGNDLARETQEAAQDKTKPASD